MDNALFKILADYGILGLIAFFTIKYVISQMNAMSKRYDSLFQKMIEEKDAKLDKLERHIDDVNKSIINHNVSMVKSTDGLELKLREIKERIELKNGIVNNSLSDFKSDVKDLEDAVSSLKILVDQERSLVTNILGIKSTATVSESLTTKTTVETTQLIEASNAVEERHPVNEVVLPHITHEPHNTSTITTSTNGSYE